MYSYLSETDDSTTVNASAYGKFLPGQSTGNQLVTIGAKYIRIFRTNPYALVPPKDVNEDWTQKTRLECVFSSRLLSSVKSFATARIPFNSGSDALLLAFDDAKLSMVAVEERTRRLTTLSMHSFEDEYLRGGNTKNFPAPIVRSDPSSRCAAMLFYGNHLAVFPFIEGQQSVRSFVIPLKQIDARLDNVVDIVFLDGYYEPTLLFLYEPLQTTAGRSSIRFDTMHIMGVSVNVIDRQFAVVWQLGGLPMDGNRLLAVPKPIGGAIIFGANDIIYLNQAVPPCGIVLNSCYDNCTKFPLKDMRSLAMTLDASCSEWLGSGRVAVGTMDGQLMMLTLTTDGAHSVKSLHLEAVQEISTPYCMTVCAAGHLFIGSRLGDSQLLKYTIETDVKEASEEEGSSAKKARVEKDVDEDDLELYGDADDADVEQSAVITEERWSFEELDRLTNIGPIKAITAGGAHDTSPILLEDNRSDPVFDLVAATGHGKDGALCVLQRTIRPEVITSSSLESAQQMWSVGQNEDGSHKYLIVSRTRSTLVLELGEEMVELEEPLFITSEPTVAAGELADGGLAVQVTSMCLALVADGEQLQEVQLDSNFPVVAASIVDPYVALLTQNGRLLLFQLAVHPHVHLKEMNVSNAWLGATHAPLTAISIYKDMSGMMVCSSGRTAADFENAKSKKSAPDPDDDDLYGNSALEDAEDMLLYGDSSKAVNSDADLSRKRKRVGTGVVSAATGGEESDAVDPNMVEPSFWLILSRDNGKVVVHSLPDMTVVFQVRKFCGMPELLMDVTEDEDEKEKRDLAVEQERKSKEGDSENPENAAETQARQDERIVELQIIGMGISQSRPILMAVVDDMLIVYEMFSLQNPQAEHLCVAFRRLPLTICLRNGPYMGPDGRRANVQLGVETERQRSIIHPFDRICTVMHGVMIGGAYPCMVLVGAWGGLRHHPLTIDGPLRSFTPFNNQNVANGFLYLTDTSQELRIAKLQSDFDYELPYPCKKVHVGATVHHVRYMMQSQVYAVTTSFPEKSNKVWVVVNDDKQEETHEKPENFVLPSIPKYSVNLYSPEDWGKVPNTEMAMEPMEVITACEEVALRSESTMSGMQTYLALGTINNYGEEHLVRGRIIIAEIIEVVPEPGLPTSKHKLKTLYDTEQKAPVTAICAMNGFLLSGMGQKIFIWGFKDNELQGISFLDMHYYVHSLVSLRNLALACDTQTSMSLIRFQEQFKALSVASKDDRLAIQSPMQAQFLIDHTSVAFLLSDEAGNICAFNYMPELKESNGGEKLTLRGVLNIGSNVNAWIRVKGHTSLSGFSPADAKVLAQHQTTVWASLDGSLGYVRPISEKSFRRLSFLHQVMTVAVRHTAGLNPKGARSARPPRPIINSAIQRNMVDGDVVSQFMHLSTAEKQDIARRLGASRYHILDDLIHIQRLATYF